MMKIIKAPINKVELKELAGMFDGLYIKVVVDIEQQILAAGAKMHVDEEILLIENGSNRENLWGAGYDLDENKVTFDSIVNIRPGINESNEILNPEIRNKVENIIRKLLI